MSDYLHSDTIILFFTTRKFSTGVPTALASGAISVFEEGNTTPITAGITLTASYGATPVVGLNHVEIVATTANGYDAGKDYCAYISTGTVDSVSVVGEIVARFSLSKEAAFERLGAPAGASIAADLVVIDNFVDGLETTIGAAGAGLTAITGVTLAPTTGLGSQNGPVATVTTLTNLPAITANWLTATGMDATASAEIADAVWDEAQADHVAVGSFGITASEIADILVDTAEIGAAGAGLTAIDLPNQTMNITGNITGNLVGTVSTLTTYTGNTPQTADVATLITTVGAAGAGLTALATQASVNTIDDFLDTEITAIKNKTDSLTFTVAGQVDSNMLAISGSTAAADNLEESTEAIVYGTASGGSTTTVIAKALTPDATLADQWKGRVLIFKNDTTTAALRGQATTISSHTFVSAEVVTFTVVLMTTAPADNDTFVIL